ncbi:MAG: hypothetical protein AB7N73_05620 [Gemmatimonadales bacterium]
MSSLRGWLVLPQPRQVSWGEARELLAAARNPLLTAALVEPGVVALWTPDDFDAAGLRSIEAQFRNQVSFFDAKLEAFGLKPDDEVETPDEGFRLGVREFRRWAHEYCLPATGIGMLASPRPRTARLSVRYPGGCRAPVGWVEPGG